MIVLVMGVSGSGKTTIGERVAQRLGWRYIEGDDYHPRKNVEKMAAGVPLDDADREPWLKTLNAVLRKEEDAVIGCSALKERYRATLFEGVRDYRIAYLHGSRELLARRLGISVHTVGTHIKNAYRKLGVRRAADAVTRAAELALLAGRSDKKEGA